MTSVLRELQAEWNAMVPQAQARGIRRVRLLGGGDVNRGPLESIAYRRQKVEWLRSLLGGSTLAGLDALSFGVELEVILPSSHDLRQAAAEVAAAGVPCEYQPYGHAVPQGKWKVVTDGSLGSYSRGAEFVSPPLRGAEGFRQLEKVCEVLTRIRAKVTRKCGLHVHVGVGSEGVEFFKNLVGLYESAQHAIDQFMPASRRGGENVFCQPVRSNRTRLQAATSVDAVASAIGQTPGRTYVRGGDRYCKLNLKSYWAYGTVEFRHHAGTVEKQKATNWVRLCLRMVLTARAGEQTVGTVDQLMDAVGADEAERAYFRGRVAYFARDAAPNNFTTYADQTHPRAGHVNQNSR